MVKRKRRKGFWCTQRLHEARMVEGLGLCSACLGWIDDPRHTSIGPVVRGVSFVLRLR